MSITGVYIVYSDNITMEMPLRSAMKAVNSFNNYVARSTKYVENV